MKKGIVKVGKKIILFLREVMNLVGNLLTPVASLLVATASLLQLPTKVIKGLKKFEYWLFYIGGTLPTIEKQLEEADKILDDFETK